MCITLVQYHEVCKTHKDKSTEIFPPSSWAMPRAKERSAKGSNFKEDDRVYITLCCLPLVPVLAKPAMQWSRQGHPQNTDTKTTMKVITFAGCSLDVATVASKEKVSRRVCGSTMKAIFLKLKLNDLHGHNFLLQISKKITVIKKSC